jgi:hypothetical protein
LANMPAAMPVPLRSIWLSKLGFARLLRIRQLLLFSRGRHIDPANQGG